MKALLYRGPQQISYESVDDPTPRDLDGAVVKVTACGICGSDLHIYGGHGFSQDLGFCVGHEAVGEVVEVGSGVRRFRAGDRVLLPASVGCNACEPCRAGRVTQCRNGQALCYGLGHFLEGSQAEAVAVPSADANLLAMPDGLSDEAALMLTDNLPTAWYGARRARIQPGDTVAVVGLGPVGLLSVLSAQQMGASKIVGIDLVAERRARAAALGVETADSKDAALAGNGHEGFDVVLEAVGADATIRMAIGLARRAGRVSVVGVNQTSKFPFPMALAQFNELEFHIGLCSVQYELPVLVRQVLGGRLDPTVAITHRLPLSDGVRAYDIFANRLDGVGKVVLDPSR